MVTTQTKLHRPTRPAVAPQPVLDPEPTLGLWGDHLAVALVGTLVLGLLPVVMAFGLGWVNQAKVLEVLPLLSRVVFAIWTLSLVGMALSIVGLSQIGGKRRTVRGLLLHTLLAIGPLAAALMLRS